VTRWVHWVQKAPECLNYIYSEEIEGEPTADDGGSNQDGEEGIAMGGGVSAELTENRSLEERRLWIEEKKGTLKMQDMNLRHQLARVT